MNVAVEQAKQKFLKLMAPLDSDKPIYITCRNGRLVLIHLEIRKDGD